MPSCCGATRSSFHVVKQVAVRSSEASSSPEPRVATTTMTIAVRISAAPSAMTNLARCEVSLLPLSRSARPRSSFLAYAR